MEGEEEGGGGGEAGESWGWRMRTAREEVVRLLRKIAALVPAGGAEVLPMNEILVFRNTTLLKNAFAANPRRTLHEALLKPQEWGQCESRRVLEGGTEKLIPDASLLYQLSLEEGRRLSMPDWLNSFRASLNGAKSNSKNKMEDTQEGGGGAQGGGGQRPRSRLMKSSAKGKANKNSEEDELGEMDMEEQAMTQARFMYAVTELQVSFSCIVGLSYLHCRSL